MVLSSEFNFSADISNEEDVVWMMQAVAARWGKLYLVPNCAGVCEATCTEEESITTV
jgi:hypothetical protein